MADDLFTFDDNIARDLLRMRDDWRRNSQASKRTRRQPLMDRPPVAGSNCADVRFEILVADSASRSALCHIMARPYGCAVADVPGTLFDGLVIEVCDPAGCYFNETDDALIGREGWAKYVLPISGASHCQSGETNYYLTEEWEVYALCCATQACQL